MGLCGRKARDVKEAFFIAPVPSLGDATPVMVSDRDFIDEGDFIDDLGDVGMGGKGTEGGMEGMSSALRADRREWTDGGRVMLLTILILLGSMANVKLCA